MGAKSPDSCLVWACQLLGPWNSIAQLADGPIQGRSPRTGIMLQAPLPCPAPPTSPGRRPSETGPARTRGLLEGRRLDETRAWILSPFVWSWRHLVALGVPAPPCLLFLGPQHLCVRGWGRRRGAVRRTRHSSAPALPLASLGLDKGRFLLRASHCTPRLICCLPCPTPGGGLHITDLEAPLPSKGCPLGPRILFQRPPGPQSSGSCLAGFPW